jgi:putative phosphoesterase
VTVTARRRCAVPRRGAQGCLARLSRVVRADIVRAVLLGILSDTHGRRDAARAAVELLRSRGAKYLIHCGDVGGEEILDLLAGDDPPAAFVWGNNDFDRDDLARYARSVGVNCLETFGSLTLDGKTIAVTHGDLARPVRKVLAAQDHDYLLVGHSHVPSDQRVGWVRVINPGALHRAAAKTVALLDLATDRLDLLTLRM